MPTTTRRKKKSLLDLIGEFAHLHDEKVRLGGMLPPEQESRWSELKVLYDLLMAEESFHDRRSNVTFDSDDIRAKVTSRERLRVPAELEMLVRREGDYITLRAVNVSRGGVFLASAEILPVGTPLTVLVANAGRGSEAVFEADGVVAWVAEGGSEIPRGMGVRFLASRDEIQRELDRLVVDTLERRLRCADATALPPNFIEKENLEI